MTIRRYGGVFGRNPKFHTVEVEDSLSVAGQLIVGGQSLTALNYKGAWNANTNSPTLASSTGTTGDVYIVSVGGTTTLNGISNWAIGDWLIFNGTAWQRIEGGANGNFVELTSSSTTTLNGTTIPASKTLLVSTDIGSTVQGYDADTAKYDDATANFTGTLQQGGSNVLKASDIGSSVQGYDADTAKYDDTTANFTGTLQQGGSNVLKASDIGSSVQAYDADTAKYDDTTANFTGTLQQGGSNVLKASDIGSSVQGYDADTAKYDDATANFTGTLQNGGSNVVVDSDIGSTVQGYDADTTKNDVSNTFTQPQIFPAGSVTNPSITTTGDTNTGIYFPAANVIAVVTDGVLRLYVNASGYHGINTNNPSELLHVADGNIRTSNSSSSSSAFLSVNNDNSTNGVIVQKFGSAASGTLFGLSRAALSTIWSESTANFAIGTLGNAPLILGTNDAERVRVDADALSLSGVSGIKFQATQSASANANTLDDYEEGTFTATLTGSTTAPTTAATATGNYIKIGPQVTINIWFSAKNTTGGAGNMLVTGLPFTSKTGSEYRTVSTTMQYGLSVPNLYNTAFLDGNTTTLEFYSAANNGNWTQVTLTAGTDKYLGITHTYQAA